MLWRGGDDGSSREFMVEPLDVKGIRERQGLSQTRFASLLGISVKTLRKGTNGIP